MEIHMVSGGAELVHRHFRLMLVTEGSSEEEPKFKEWGPDSTSLVGQLENHLRKCLVLERGDDLGPAIH